MSFLDIGSGGGASFQTIFQLISGVNCFAFEPDVQSRKFLQEKLKVHVYPYAFQHKPRQTTSASIGNSKFDFILMSHVLEHFNGKDIVSVLKNVRSLLSKDGIFVCEVPHCDLRSHEHMRTNDTPHISFFSKNSLTLSLEHAGLKTLFLNTCGEEYDQWWEKHKQAPNLKNKAYKIAKIIRLCRMFYGFLPISIPNRLAISSYSFILPNWVNGLLSSTNFNYGGNRMCLRAVATMPD